jgi:hypothetical protein
VLRAGVFVVWLFCFVVLDYFEDCSRFGEVAGKPRLWPGLFLSLILV